MNPGRAKNESASIVLLQHPSEGTASALHIHTTDGGAELPGLLRDVLADPQLWRNEAALAAAFCAEMLRVNGTFRLTAYPVQVDYPWLIVDVSKATVSSQRAEAEKPSTSYTFEEFQQIEDWTQLGLDPADELDD